MKPIYCAALFILLVLALVLSHNDVYADQSSVTPKDVWHVKVNEQIQIVSDVTNSQDTKQPFAYIIQVLDDDGKVVLLNWITGTLQPHQSMSPAQSWTPTKTGTYTAQIFDWPCLVNCGAISMPLTMNIVVDLGNSEIVGIS